MDEEQPFSGRESLQVIEEMIGKVKSDFHESGISALLWGSVIIICSLVSLANLHLQIPELNMVWWLTFAAVVPQIIISIREGKRRRYKTYTSDAMSGIWLSFGVAVFLVSFYIGYFKASHSAIIFLVLYGMPTFATGYLQRFTPMIVGGLMCWVFALLAFFTDSAAHQYILFALAAFFAWLLPGIILRRKYLKAKRQHV